MKIKFVLPALLLGLLLNMIFILVIPSTQLAVYEGFDEPTDSDFQYESEINGVTFGLCYGVNFPVVSSIRKVGFPFSSKATVDYDDCTDITGLNDNLYLVVASVSTPQFYLNWVVWSVFSYVPLLISKKIYNTLINDRLKNR